MYKLIDSIKDRQVEIRIAGDDYGMMSVCLSVCLSVCMYVCMYVCPALDMDWIIYRMIDGSLDVLTSVFQSSCNVFYIDMHILIYKATNEVLYLWPCMITRSFVEKEEYENGIFKFRVSERRGW